MWSNAMAQKKGFGLSVYFRQFIGASLAHALKRTVS
jgi:hypothetical protein